MFITTERYPDCTVTKKRVKKKNQKRLLVEKGELYYI